MPVVCIVVYSTAQHAACYAVIGALLKQSEKIELKRVVWLLAIVLVLLSGIWITRAVVSRDLPDLSSWHRPVLLSEYRARDYPDGITFPEYRALENKLIAEIDTLIGDTLESPQRVITNRYYQASPAHHSRWASNWNLSFELIPTHPKGAVVLLHGASDSPYSMRALAQAFHAAGLYVIVPRLPGNGTIPGELTAVSPADWQSILPMALARVREHVGPADPLYLGGYSTGATIALDYALRAMTDPQLRPVSGLYLFSPAVGVTAYARFARWDLLVSKIPGFEKFAWITVWPEYDPFKYASFPKQAGFIVHSVASDNEQRIEKLRSTDHWQRFPPVLTFQSLIDATVSVSAILDLYETLPINGSQLVLFDVNRDSMVTPFLGDDGSASLLRIAAENWADSDVTIVSSSDTAAGDVLATRRCRERQHCDPETTLKSQWPAGVFSLSHIAIPFSPNDPVYGGIDAPQAPGTYNLGRVHAKGERRVLIIPAEDVNRLRHNPFFDYLRKRALEFCDVCASSN